jgi:hypothetical protein
MPWYQVFVYFKVTATNRILTMLDLKVKKALWFWEVLKYWGSSVRNILSSNYGTTTEDHVFTQIISKRGLRCAKFCQQCFTLK